MTDKRERRKEIDLLIVTPESVTHDVTGAESGHLQTNGVVGVKCERKPFVERRRSNVWDGWLPATANPNPPRQRGSVWKKRAPRERRARKDVERHELIMRLFSLRGRKKTIGALPSHMGRRDYKNEEFLMWAKKNCRTKCWAKSVFHPIISTGTQSPTVFWHPAHSEQCFVQLLVSIDPGFTTG
jgi:hypothetical protein